MRKLDFIIVGQGIAGSMISWSLYRAGKTFKVIDKINKHSASSVAAGIINPIVFKRLTSSWKAKEIIPSILKTYQELELELGFDIIKNANLLKIIGSQDEIRMWKNKLDDSDVKGFISKEIMPVPQYVNADHGAFNITASYYVKQEFLSNFRNWLSAKDSILEEEFKYDKLKYSDSGIEYSEQIKADKIIFCEGSECTKNPWFGSLPFVLTKGEMITVFSDELSENEVLSKDIYIVPIGNHYFKIGSTYEWKEINEDPTEKGKEYLISKFEQLLPVKYKIIAHEAGIRPAVKDRRPLIGVHPEHKNLLIFNGMGTKGFMLAPFFANEFVRHILTESYPLDPEINIARYKELLS